MTFKRVEGFIAEEIRSNKMSIKDVLKSVLDAVSESPAQIGTFNLDLTINMDSQASPPTDPPTDPPVDPPTDPNEKYWVMDPKDNGNMPVYRTATTQDVGKRVIKPQRGASVLEKTPPKKIHQRRFTIQKFGKPPQNYIMF